MKNWIILFLILLSFSAFAEKIEFLIDGRPHKTLEMDEIKKMKAEEVEYFHRTTKRAERYKGVSTLSFLESVYPDFSKKYAEVEFKTHSEFNGYVDVGRLQKFTSILAYDRADGDTFTRFSTRTQKLVKLDPLYLVWDTKGVPREERDPLVSIYQVYSINALTKNIALTRPEDRILKGFGLYKENCLSCHAVGAMGGKIGGNLVDRNVLANRGNDYVKKYIINPRGVNPKSTMFPINVVDKEASALAIIDFLTFARDPEKKVAAENPKSSAYLELQGLVKELQKKEK